MKTTLTSLFLLLSLAGFSQTQKGVFIGVGAESSNLTRDKKLLVGTKGEIGYSFGAIAISGVYHRLLNEPTHERHASSAGLKVMGNVATLWGITLSPYAEMDAHIKPIDHGIRNDFEYRFGAQISMEIVPNSGFYANSGYQILIYNQMLRGEEITKRRNGGFIGFIYSL